MCPDPDTVFTIYIFGGRADREARTCSGVLCVCVLVLFAMSVLLLTVTVCIVSLGTVVSALYFRVRIITSFFLFL